MGTRMEGRKIFESFRGKGKKKKEPRKKNRRSKNMIYKDDGIEKLYAWITTIFHDAIISVFARKILSWEKNIRKNVTQKPIKGATSN